MPKPAAEQSSKPLTLAEGVAEVIRLADAAKTGNSLYKARTRAFALGGDVSRAGYSAEPLLRLASVADNGIEPLQAAWPTLRPALDAILAELTDGLENMIAESAKAAEATAATLKDKAAGDSKKLVYYVWRTELKTAARLAGLAFDREHLTPLGFQGLFHSQAELERCTGLIGRLDFGERQRLTAAWPTRGEKTILGFAGRSAADTAERFCLGINAVLVRARDDGPAETFFDRAATALAGLPELAGWAMRDLVRDVATITASLDNEFSAATEAAMPEPAAATVAVTPAEPVKGLFSPEQLAERFGLPAGAVRKRLERYRKHNLSGWVENTERLPREPRFTYEFRAVRHILDGMIEKQTRRTKTSSERPAKKI
ncbi:MAG: hypothetical protein ACP5QA_16760 [Phycisphaerae bacterium]